VSCVGRRCYQDPREDIGHVSEDRGIYSKRVWGEISRILKVVVD